MLLLYVISLLRVVVVFDVGLIGSALFLQDWKGFVYGLCRGSRSWGILVLV